MTMRIQKTDRDCGALGAGVGLRPEHQAAACSLRREGPLRDPRLHGARDHRPRRHGPQPRERRLRLWHHAPRGAPLRACACACACACGSRSSAPARDVVGVQYPGPAQRRRFDSRLFDICRVSASQVCTGRSPYESESPEAILAATRAGRRPLVSSTMPPTLQVTAH